MRIIPLVLSAILVVATAAPSPGRYSSASNYQFQRSSSSYRNNELQHKNEEAGVYGRIEDPDKYDKPLEQSHYRQSSYHAPGTDTDDDSSEEDEYPSQTVGIKGGRPNSYLAHGHSANYHRGYGHFDQGVIDSDYTTGDSFYQPGRFPHEHQHQHNHPPGFHYPSGNHYGHRQHGGYHHDHGYHHQHGFATQETSSQSSATQNKDDQLISLDQTFDYSKFKNQGFGKEYLENTEGERVTSPRSVVSTTENIRPIFETTEPIPEQPGFSSQIGNNGRGIQENQNREQQGQSSATTFGQNSQQGQNIDLSIFGQNSQQGQTTTGQQVFNEAQTTTGQFGSASQIGNNQDTQQQVDIGQTFQQGPTSQQGQVFSEDQSTTGQFGSASQIGNNQDTQQQIDIGQIFPQRPSSQQDDRIFGQNSQQGQVFSEDQSTTGQFGSSQVGNNQNTQQQIDIGQTFQQRPSSQQVDKTFGQNSQGQVFSEDQSTTGQFGSSQIGNNQNTQQQVDIGKLFQGQSTSGQTIQQGGSQTGQDHLKPLFEQIDKIAEMEARDHTYFDQDQFNSGSYSSHGNGRQYNSDDHREISHHTTGYIKPKYEPHYMSHLPGVDEPDCQHKEEEKVEEKMTEEKIDEMTTQASIQETTTAEVPKEDNNMEMMNQERDEEMSGGALEPMTTVQPEEATTVYYIHHKEHGKKYDQEEHEEDLTQHSNDKQWHGDFQQHQDEFGKFDYDGQHQEDLTQHTQDSFGRIEFDGKDDQHQQHQNEWSHFGDQNQEDLSQKHDDEYGHLEFGGQQQEDLSQKNDDFHGSNYGNSYGSNGYRNSYGYSTASSRSYSTSSSSRLSSSYGRTEGRTYNYQGHQTSDLSQNQEQFANDDQDFSQQVQKVEIPKLEEQKEVPLEQEEIAVVEAQPTEKPGFWKRLGGSISRTYETAKEKVKNIG